MKSIAIGILILLSTNVSFAAAPLTDVIRTAKAVKALIEKGFPVPRVIDVQMVQRMSSPPKSCVMIVYERKPNTVCPDDFGVGPYMDKSSVACFDSVTDEVDFLGGAESQCPPKL